MLNYPLVYLGCDGDGNGESRYAAAPVNGPPLLPPGGKVGAEVWPGVGLNVTGTGGLARLYCR